MHSFLSGPKKFSLFNISFAITYKNVAVTQIFVISATKPVACECTTNATVELHRCCSGRQRRIKALRHQYFTNSAIRPDIIKRYSRPCHPKELILNIEKRYLLSRTYRVRSGHGALNIVRAPSEPTATPVASGLTGIPPERVSVNVPVNMKLPSTSVTPMSVLVSQTLPELP